MPDRKITAMHKAYGHAYGRKCGECQWLYSVELRPGWRYYKCAAYGSSSAESTDWAKKWEACALIDKTLPEVSLLEWLKYERRVDDKPVKGQLDMFGGIYHG